jgi:2-polyprenyl-6-methoxyphenol hydroxylase-like FAD-dependent oxidoreductase
MQKPEVLIIGAGPTGLMMACQLALFGVPFRIIEKNAHPVKESRALGIQARTLEIFRQMGIVDRFLQQGQITKGLTYIAGNIQRHIPLSELGKGLSEFPFLLMHEQSKTEKVFNDFLQKYNTYVEWSTELVSFTQDDSGVTAVIKHDGKEETVVVDYLFGADGARSVVRHDLGIELAGATYHQLLYVLDCDVSSPLFKDKEVYLTFSPKAFTAFFPLAHNVWRIIGVVPEEVAHKEQITFEDIKKHFSENISFPVTITHPNWLSIYHSHHRCVKKFRVGRCFLGGDAAHVHSPVGAQGMNTGLQDAYNLAWKLAFVLKIKADSSLLDTYNEERLPFAKRLVETTDRVFSLVVSKNIFKTLFTKHIAPLIMQNAIKYNFSREFMFLTISQTGISYPHSALSQNASVGDFSKSAPLPGDRLPYYMFSDTNDKTINIQEYITSTMMELLIFEGVTSSSDSLISFCEKYKDSIHTTVIKKNQNTKELFRRFGIIENGYFLVRPDIYIAYRNQGMDIEQLQVYLERFFK